VSRFGVLGTGSVGQTVGGKLVELGHEVMMGSRQAGSEKAVQWAKEAGGQASEGRFEDAAEFGEILVNATAGTASVDALHTAGGAHLNGKVLIDIGNPIDMGSGSPPALAFCNTESLGERIQRAFPDARVVKTLNTVTASVMVDPGSLPGDHNVFMSGDDPEAKQQVSELLQSFGWPAEAIVDLGDISTARGPEMYLALWLRLWGVSDSPVFNIAVVKP
jgi:8-hydroxy-5-deazaflavin:NADPH oxidoreductase